MKNLLAAALSAALLAGSVAAGAAIPSPKAKPRADVPVTATVAQSQTRSVAPWNVDLVHQTGGER